MILRPGLKDFQVVGLYVGKVVVGIGLLMTIPLLVSLYFQEWNTTIDFAIGISACLLFGYFMEFLCYTDRDLTWTHGMVVAALSWLVAMGFVAIPYYLSGHFPSFLDATFDAMSGLTTTGLFVLNDLDHISNALNMWRHLLPFAGGQGIIVVALAFMIRGTSGAFKIYVGEAREERLLPNVIQTARAIGLISLIYLTLGTAVLWVLNVIEGMSLERGFFHGLWLFMGSSWSTGGFAPQSLNLFYYHSLLIELGTMFIFIIGSFNFALHYAVWRGDRREIYRNLEIISFSITVVITFTLVVIGLTQLNIYPDTMSLFRKGFYILISGHTTTGNQTIFARQFVQNWGPLAMLAVTIAMAIGGSACATSGGIKGLRMGILFKYLGYELRKLISPESSVVVQKIHHIRDTILDDRMVRAAMLITICYIFIYGLGTLVGVLYGYPLSEALFESVSAASTTGLSVGITSSSMPTLLKVVFMFQMWAGRLEFMAVLALFGFVFAAVRGE